MPITAIYAPEEFALKTDRRYHFKYNWIEQSDIEVYEIITYQGAEFRYLVPITDYTVESLGNRVRYPVKTGAWITFTREHSVDTTKVVIERNTLIDQTVDFPKHAKAYNGRIVGVAFDKATMIFQEIAQRKCDVTVTTPITQLVDWTAYDDFKASVLKASVDKLFAIASEIDATGEDCTQRPEDA